MAYELPKIESSIPPLDISHFPTLYQCFIYRNWDMITPERMALVLDCDNETVKAEAAALGLPENTADESLWLTRGYITLIRANWHLLTYAQICTMLGWSEEKLCFILREDDFLDVKLGNHKPDCDTLRVIPLTEAQRERTAIIAESTREILAAIGSVTVKPFDFSPFYSKMVGEKGESRYSDSFIASYCALYGDVFSDESLIEASFPDALLKAYSDLGIGGIWTQAVLYAMTPCKYDMSLSEGWERRLSGLNKVIARLKKYGLKLYLYINEPRQLHDSVFEKNPHLRGDHTDDGYSSLCLSVPEAQDFLRESIAFLTKNAPGLGGYLTIVSSENRTNCYSHRMSGQTNCPHCASLKRADLYALVNRLIYEGASSVDPEVKVFAYSWGWNREERGFEDTVDGLPPEVAVLSVSERSAKKVIGDVEVSVDDYSISIPGPSDYTVETLGYAKKAGNRIAAKLQLNNSWELAAVPYIPVFGLLYRAISDLWNKVSPNVVMLTWTHGGFPSPVLRMFSELAKKSDTLPTEDQVRRMLFPNADDILLALAFDEFDRAFEEFPFAVRVMYYGPMHMGPALPLWLADTKWPSCMVGPVYDDLTRWRRYYSEELFEGQFEKICTGWKNGLSLLEAAFEGRELSDDDRLLIDCARVSFYHFESSLNHIKFIRNRHDRGVMLSIIDREEKLAIDEAVLVGRNPTIGYESSNHYFFTRTDLMEKVIICRHLRERLLSERDF